MNLHLHSDHASRPLADSLMVQRARRYAVPSRSAWLAYVVMAAGFALGVLTCLVLFTLG